MEQNPNTLTRYTDKERNGPRYTATLKELLAQSKAEDTTEDLLDIKGEKLYDEY